jgi:hypothetical protein
MSGKGEILSCGIHGLYRKKEHGGAVCSHAVVNKRSGQMRILFRDLKVLAMFLTFSCHALATQAVEGINFEESANVAGQRLVLNGIGVGQQLAEKVHVTGLYIASKQSDNAKILTLAGAKRLEIVFMRKVPEKASSRFFINALRQSGESKALAFHFEDMTRFGELFGKNGDRSAGDRVQIDWVPGTGIEVRINGKLAQPVINNEIIYRVLLDGFVGIKAPRRLREGLLSTPSTQ